MENPTKYIVALFIILFCAVPFRCYSSSGEGPDYALGFYISSTSTVNLVMYTYTNDTGLTIKKLSGQFDLELPWSRFSHATRHNGGFNNGFRYAVTTGGANLNASGWPNVKGYAWGELLVGRLVLSNASVTAGYETKWLDDTEMDALSLSKRTQIFAISNLSLSPGDQITFVWFADECSGNHKGMLQAVDNFLLKLSTPDGAFILYNQDFDAEGQAALSTAAQDSLHSAPTGWKLKVNNTDVTNSLTVSDGSSLVWGGNHTGYYAAAAVPDSGSPTISDLSGIPEALPLNTSGIATALLNGPDTSRFKSPSPEFSCLAKDHSSK